MYVPSITNASVTTAESSVDIPQHTRQILIQCRTAVDIKVAFVSGETASNFVTVKSGTGFNLVLSTGNAGGLLPSAAKLYLLAASSVVAEIIFAG